MLDDPFSCTMPIPEDWEAPPSGPVSESRAVLRVGEVLDGTYAIRGLLGQGGMGQVFEAIDLQLRRHVAIKVAWPHIEPDVLRREAQALAQIRHPCAITIYAIRQHGGIDYLVMERLFGITLEQHMERIGAARQPFTVEEALEVLIGIVDGLVAIHRATITHRDIKPSNIMLAPGNRVVLMDFGLFVPDVLAGGKTVGLVSGSPAYMAPESIRSSIWPGAVQLIDLYAVGVIAFEMLTGRLPFDGETVEQVLQAHLMTTAPQVSELRRDVPEEVSALVARLLAKERSARPQSAELLLEELHAIRARRRPRAEDEPFSVLIADDDDLVRDMLSALISRAMPDAQIATASSGAAAIERVRARPPNILVLDLQMPDINGVEVCMYLRGTHLAERCKIVLVSGDADQRDVALLRQLGISHYLPKSAKLHEELAQVMRALRREAG